jgi:hypothetical protein
MFHGLVDLLDGVRLVGLFALWPKLFARSFELLLLAPNRKAIHENSFQSPMSMHCFIERYIADLEMTRTLLATVRYK